MVPQSAGRRIGMVFVGFSSGSGCRAPQHSDKPPPSPGSFGLCPVGCRYPGAGTVPAGELALPQGCIAELDQNTAHTSAKQTLLRWARSRLRAGKVGPEARNRRTEVQELGEELGAGGGSHWSPGEPRFSSWREFLQVWGVPVSDAGLEHPPSVSLGPPPFHLGHLKESSVCKEPLEHPAVLEVPRSSAPGRWKPGSSPRRSGSLMLREGVRTWCWDRFSGDVLEPSGREDLPWKEDLSWKENLLRKGGENC